MRLARAARLVLILVLTASTLTWADPIDSTGAHAAGDAAFSIKRRLPKGPPGGRPLKSPSLESQLAATAATARTQGRNAALNQASDLGVKVVDEKVRVVIQTKSTDLSAAKQLVARVGGDFESHYKTLTQALVPVDALRRLESDPAVVWVRRPIQGHPQSVTGEGVAAIGANVLQAEGITGKGVKVAIVDVGFDGYQDRIKSGDLHNVAGTDNFGCTSVENSDAHGTEVAEIVSEIAPDATLYLICVGGSALTLPPGAVGDIVLFSGLAKDRAIELGVDIIQMSLGWDHDGRGDGTGGAGTIEAIVKDAREHGILWVASAGNSARAHWHGTFIDTDGNFFNAFRGTDELNTVNPGFDVRPGDYVALSLIWNDWPASSQDYDLYLYEIDQRTGDALGILASSESFQNGTQYPRESLDWTNVGATTIRAGVAIFDYNKSQGLPTSSPRLDLFKWPPYVDIENFAYATRSGSLTFPGGVADTLTVAAICWKNDHLQEYRSQGPTPDGRLKPDIAGQTNVTTSHATFSSCPANDLGIGGFDGTSAAAPHVSGAAALLKSINPGFSPSQIKSLLESQAKDLGEPGKDPQFGAGRLTLTAPASHVANAGSSSQPQNVSQDDTDPSRKNTEKNKDVKETEEHRQQRERTNQSNKDDYTTEGNVRELHLDARPPYIVIANRDGLVVVQLQCGSQCPMILVGDYVEIDGVKENEGLYEAEWVAVTRISR